MGLKEAIGSKTSLAEAGTATHFPLSESSDRKGLLKLTIPASTMQSCWGDQFCSDSKGSALFVVNWIDCAAYELYGLRA